jgi:hypothetical protein
VQHDRSTDRAGNEAAVAQHAQAPAIAIVEQQVTVSLSAAGVRPARRTSVARFIHSFSAERGPPLRSDDGERGPRSNKPSDGIIKQKIIFAPWQHCAGS